MEKLWIRFPERANMEMSSGSARRHGPPEDGIHIPTPGGIMSAARNAGIRKIVRQFALAMVACTAVAGGASLVATPQSAPAQLHQQADGTNDDWPAPTPAPTN
jgi:hypothetical protein